jgi:hypothetical protein
MDKPPLKIQWEDIRMLSFDGFSVTILMRGDRDPKTYSFQSREELEKQMDLWFGRKGWHNPDGSVRNVQ